MQGGARYRQQRKQRAKISHVMSLGITPRATQTMRTGVTTMTRLSPFGITA